MGTFAPSTTELVLGNDVYSETKRFISESDSRTLTATLYNVPEDTSLFNNAGRVVFNMGNINPYRDPLYGNANGDNKAKWYKDTANEISSKGVDVRRYSNERTARRVHIKSYTAAFNGRPEAFISTANLSQGSSTPLITNRGERIRRSREGTLKQNQTQHNLGLRIKDPNIVKQISEVQSELSKNQLPNSRKDVLIGDRATSRVVSKLNKSKKGDTIVISAPYLDDNKVVNSLIYASSKGANVTVLSSHRDKTQLTDNNKSGSRNTLASLDSLASNGVRVMTPSANDPILIHTKALVINSENSSELFLGSHNFTNAARRNDSVDLLVNLTDKNLAYAVQNELLNFSENAGLIRHKITKNSKQSNVEIAMNARGMTGIYKVDTTLKNISTREAVDYTVAMPNYPTRMSQDFFSAHIGSDLPRVSLYSDIWASRVGDKIAPRAVIQMDRELSDPGLGNRINHLFGTELYQADKGILGSAFIGTGKLIDWAFGFEKFQEDEQARKGKNSGSIRKLLGLSATEQRDNEGPFEAIATQLHGVISGAAMTLATYIAFDLPFKYIKAKAESDFFNLAIQQKNKVPTSTKDLLSNSAISFSRNMVFGVTKTTVINDIDFLHANSQAELIEKLKEEYKETRVGFVHKARRRVKMFGVFGRSKGGSAYYSQAMSLSEHNTGVSYLTGIKLGRAFDASRFDMLLRPIFELINPYDLDSDFSSEFMKSLDELGDTNKLRPDIGVSNKHPGRYEFKNIGVDILRKAAVAYDNISSLLPANMLYWTRPTRELLNLPKFDPRENITIRDLVSFENAVKWADDFYSKASTIIKNPAESVRRVASAWRNEINLVVQEQALVKELLSIPDVSKPNVDINHSSTSDLITSLHEYESNLFSSKEGAINKLLSDNRFKKYKKDIDAQSLLLRKDPFISGQSTYFSENPFKTDGSPQKARIDAVKKNLLHIGVLLVADSLADQFIFKPLGASLTTQIRAHSELETEDGTVARFQFDGTLSRTQAIGIQAIGALAGGYAFPVFTDPAADLDSLVSVVGRTRSTVNSLEAIKNSVTGGQSYSLTDELVAAQKKAYRAGKKYQHAESNLKTAISGRSRLRFNKGTALLGAFVASIASKTIAAGSARVLNYINNRDRVRTNLSDSNGVLAARFERLTKNALDNAVTKEDYVDAAMAHAFTRQMLAANDGESTNRIYTLASQVTTPFFQLPIVVKIDPIKERASIGVGLQLMSTTGIGFTPLLPVAFEMRRDSKATEKAKNIRWFWKNYDRETSFSGKETNNRKSENIATRITNNIQDLSRAGVDIIGFAASAGSRFTYEEDSVFESGLEFVGVSTGLLLTASAIKDADPVSILSNKFGSDSRIVTEFSDLVSYTKSLRNATIGGLELANKSMRFMYTIPVQLSYATASGTSAVAKELQNSFNRYSVIKPPTLENFKFSQSYRARRLAPYVGAVLFAGLLTDEHSDYVEGEEFSTDPYYRTQAMLTAGSVIGFGLDRTGVFATSEQLAQDFRELQNSRGKGNLDGYRSAVGKWMPKVDISNKENLEAMDEIVQGMIEARPAKQRSYKKIHLSGHLLGEMSAPALWNQGVEKAKLTTKTGLDSAGSRFKNKLPGAAIKSVGARIALAAVVTTAIKTTSFTAAQLLSDSQLRSLYSVPLIGPGMRLLAQVEVDDERLNGESTRGVVGATSRGGLGKVVQKLFNSLTFGVFGIGENTGMYSDEPDAFFNLIGPVGLSFKTNRVGNYVQHSSAFTDLSYTAYDLVRGGNTTESFKRNLYTQLEKSGTDRFDEAWRFIRGGTARSSAARHEGTTSSEMAVLSKSSSLARAVSIRHFMSEHQSWQSAQEHAMDFMRMSFKYGGRESDVLPEEMRPKLYNPLGVLKNASIQLTSRVNKADSGSGSRDSVEDQMTKWIVSSNYRRSTLVKGYGLSISPRPQWASEVDKLPGGAVLAGIVQTVGFFTFFGLLDASIGGLLATFNINEQESLINSSFLNQAQGNIHKAANKYRFMPVKSSLTGESHIYMVDMTHKSTNVYRLPNSVEDINRIGSTDFSGMQIASSLQKKYGILHKDLNNTLHKGFTTTVGDLYKAVLEQTDLDYNSAVKAFKTRAIDQINQTIKRHYQATVGDSPVTMFSLLTGADSVNQNKVLDNFINESDALLNVALDEMLEELADIRSTGIQRVDPQTGRFRLNSAFTNSDAFKEFYNRLEKPIHGSFIEGSRRAAANQRRNKRVLGRELGENIDVYTDRLRNATDAGRVRSTYSMPSASIRAASTTWSEGFIKSSVKSAKAASGLTAAWAFEGVSIYEMTEAALVLSGGKSESKIMRQAAGVQLVESVLYWATGAAIAAGLVAAGVGGLPALVLGFGASFGLEYLKDKLAPVNKVEQGAIRAVASLLERPVDTISKPLDNIGLGGASRFIGNMLATPSSFLLRKATAPFRHVLRNVVAPVLQSQHLKMATDNAFWQTAKSMLLPRSVFVNFNYETGKSTWAGTEPWVYGNTTLLDKQQQLNKINTAIQNDGKNLDSDTVHPFMTGGLSSSYERMIHDKYFSSVAGGRIFDPFAPGAMYSMSNSMRLALQRRNSLFEMTVVANGISGAPEVEDLSALSTAGAAYRTLATVQYEDFSTNVLTTLRHNIASSVSFTKSSYRKIKDYIGYIGNRASGLLPAKLRTAISSISHKVKFPRRTLKAIALKGTRKTGKVINRVIRSTFELVGAKAPNLTAKGKTLTSRFLSVVDNLKGRVASTSDKVYESMPGLIHTGLNHITDGIRKVKQEFAMFSALTGFKNKLNYVLDAELPGANFLVNNLHRVVRYGSNKLFNAPRNTYLWLQRVADPRTINTRSKFGRFLSGIATVQIKFEDYWSGPVMDALWEYKNVAATKFLIPLNRSIDNVFARADWLVKGTNKKLSRHITAGKALYGAFAAADIATSIYSDSRFNSLGKGDSFREYEAAYTEAAKDVSGSVIGMIAGGLTRNPLIALGAAILGGNKIGDITGYKYAQNAFNTRHEDDTPIRDYLNRSLLMGGLINLSKLPEYYKLAKAGNIAGIGKRIAFNSLMSLGTSGLGPSTQFALMSYGSDAADYASTHRESLKAYGNQLRKTGREAPDYVNLIFKNRVSTQVADSASTYYRELVNHTLSTNSLTAPDLDALAVDWKGSRWMPEGEFTGNSVRLSTSTQSILGRAKLGRYVPTEMLDESVFISLHEIAHSLEIKSNLTRLEKIDVLQLATKLEVKPEELSTVIEKMAQQSTADVVKGGRTGMYDDILDSANANRIYTDELSATARTFKSMADYDLDAAKRVYAKKASTYYKNREDIQAFFSMTMEDAKSFENDFVYTSRNSPAGSSRRYKNRIQRVNRSKPSISPSRPNPAISRPNKVNATKTIRTKKVFDPSTKSYRSAPELSDKLIIGSDLFEFLDDSFTLGDVALGIYATNKIHQINERGNSLTKDNVRQRAEQLKDIRQNQAGNIASSVAGILGSFITKNGFIAFGLGLSAGIAGELDLFGHAERQVEKDIKNIQEDGIIYDPFQSQSIYVRLHRSFQLESDISKGLFAPLSRNIAQYGKKAVNAGQMIKGLANSTTHKGLRLGRVLADKASAGQFTKVTNSAHEVLTNSRASKSLTRVIQSSLLKSERFTLDSIKTVSTFANKALKKLTGSLTTLGDDIAGEILKTSPILGRHIISLGYRESLLNALAVGMDVASFVFGAGSLLSLNSSSSKAQVMSAYSQMGAARGSIIGSILGKNILGDTGDTIGSILGSMYGADHYDELASLRYDTDDYGAISLLDDMVQPMSREVVVARAASRAAGKGLSSAGKQLYRNAIVRRAASAPLRRVDKISTLTSTIYKESVEKAAKEGQERLIRVVGREAAEQGSKRFGRVIGNLATTAKRFGKVGRLAGKVIDPLISTALLVSAVDKSNKATTARDHESAIRRSSGAIGSMAGFAIGTALGGPLGGAVGAMAFDIIGDKYGSSLSDRASKKGIGSNKIVKGQIKGGVVGTVLSVLGAGALIAAGVIGGAVALPALAIAGAIGLVIGAVSGGEFSLRGRKEEREIAAKKKLDSVKGAGNYSLDVSVRESELEDRLIAASKNNENKKGIFKRLGGGLKSIAQIIQKKTTDLFDSVRKKAKQITVGAVQTVGSIFNPGNITGTGGTPNGASVLRVTRTGQKDDKGLEVLRIELVEKGTGRVVDSIFGNSGVRSTQRYDSTTSRTARPGSLSPIPTGTYNIGATTANYNDPGIGGWFVPIIGPGDNQRGRGAFGFHMDANRANSPGSAGCIVFSDTGSKEKLQSWLRDPNAPTQVTVSYAVTPPGQSTQPNAQPTTGNPSASNVKVSSQALDNNSRTNSARTPAARYGSVSGGTNPSGAQVGNPYTRTMENQNRGNTTVSFDRALVFPIQGRSRSDFNVSAGGSFWAYRRRSSGPNVHFGQDFAIATGTPLLSPYDGVITRVLAPTSRAYADVEITTTDKNGRQVSTRLGHISQVHVQVGQRVTAGQKVATSGGDPSDLGYGSGTGSHLDVKVKVDGLFVDPENLFRDSATLSTGAQGSSSAATGFNQGVSSQPVQPVGVGIISIENQKRRSGTYDASRVAQANSISTEDRTRLDRSIEVVTSAIPVINLADVTQAAVNKATTYTTEQIKNIVGVVRSQAQQATKALQNARNKTKKPTAVKVNTNNPASEMQSSTQNVDTSRPTSRNIIPSVEVEVSTNASGNEVYRVGVDHGPSHVREWDSITGLPPIHDYQNMDPGVEYSYA